MDKESTKYFTEKGSETLKTRLKTLIRLFNENNAWGKELIMLGFPKLKIDDREECFGRIKELSELTQTQIKMYKIESGDKIDYKIEI